MSLPPDIIACAQIVERGDPDRFAATMAAPVAARARLFPIYAFNVEVSRAPWVTQEPMIAEMRLQWWRDVLDEIRQGGSVRRHEVATPLAEVIDTDSANLLDPLIDARRWDIHRDPFQDMNDFRAHITQTSGHLLLAAARSLGPAHQGALLKAGYAQGLANWLRATPTLEAAGRRPLVDGTPDGIRALAQDGLASLQEARKTAMPKPTRPALLPLWQTKAILGQAHQDPSAVTEGRLGLSPFQSKLRLMWQATSGRW